MALKPLIAGLTQTSVGITLGGTTGQIQYNNGGAFGGHKLTLTNPATGATLTIADSKTVTVSNTLTLTGTDGSTLNIGAGGTLGDAAFVNASNLDLSGNTGDYGGNAASANEANSASTDQNGDVIDTTYGKIAQRNDVTGQVDGGAMTNVLAPSSDTTYRVGAYLTITSVTLDVVQVRVTYIDETNTPRTQTFSTIAGVSSLSTTGAFVFSDFLVRVKASTTVTIATVLTTNTGSIVYDAGGYIQPL